MCGLYGGFGRRVDHQVIRTLALLNESRGRDASGIFNSLGNTFKEAERTTKFLQNPEMSKWLIDSSNTCWAICGHCRGGTRGGNVTKNAHPFKYGKVIGSHNGVLDAPVKYTVDTEYAIDLLSQHKAGEYQEALKGVSGWYVLTWIDKRNNCVYLLNWTGTLHLAKFGNTFYYSSEADHLRTALGVGEKAIVPITHKEVYRFMYVPQKGVIVDKMPDFQGKERVVVSYNNTPRANVGSYHSGRSAVGESNWMEPTGFLTKFPDGLWCAEMMNHRYRLLTNQGELNETYPKAKAGESRWRRPWSLKNNYATLSPSTPMRSLPEGFDPPCTRHTYKDIKEDSKKTEDKDDTKVITQSEEKALSPSQLKNLPHPTEDDQEAAQRAQAEAEMDKEAKAASVLTAHKAERLAFLIDVVKLTPEEATGVMTDEGLYEDDEALIVT